MNAWFAIVAVMVGLAACGDGDPAAKPKVEHRPQPAPDVDKDPDKITDSSVNKGDPVPLPRLPVPSVAGSYGAPIIEVSPTELRVNGRVIADVGQGVKARVTAALAIVRLEPSTSPSKAFIVARNDTEYATVLDVVEGARAAGFYDIAFSTPDP